MPPTIIKAGIAVATKDSTEVLLKHAPDDTVIKEDVIKNHEIFSKLNKLSLTEMIKKSEIVEIKNHSQLESKYLYIHCKGDVLLKIKKADKQGDDGKMESSYVKLPDQFIVGVEKIFRGFDFSYRILSDTHMIKIDIATVTKILSDKLEQQLFEKAVKIASE